MKYAELCLCIWYKALLVLIDIGHYWIWIEWDNPKAAAIWKSLLEKHFPEQMTYIGWYRTLFHAWIVRDMIEYTDNPDSSAAEW